jgi:hypothetical protein
MRNEVLLHCIQEWLKKFIMRATRHHEARKGTDHIDTHKSAFSSIYASDSIDGENPDCKATSNILLMKKHYNI